MAFSNSKIGSHTPVQARAVSEIQDAAKDLKPQRKGLPGLSLPESVDAAQSHPDDEHSQVLGQLRIARTLHALLKLSPTLAWATQQSGQDEIQVHAFWSVLEQAQQFSQQTWALLEQRLQETGLKWVEHVSVHDSSPDLFQQEAKDWFLAASEHAFLQAHQAYSAWAQKNPDVKISKQQYDQVCSPAMWFEVFWKCLTDESKSLDLSSVPLVSSKLIAQSFGEQKDEIAQSQIKNRFELRLIWIEQTHRLIQAQQKAHFYRVNLEEDLWTCAEKIWTSACQSLDTLLPPSSMVKKSNKEKVGLLDRQVLFITLLRQTGLAMEQAWLIEGALAHRALSQKQKNIRDFEVWRQAHPEGFPLDTVWHRFEQQVGRLVWLTQKMIQLN